ncbi:MAG: hypothetical protein ACP5JG_04890 [Anaerolineae bacterium]
MERVAFLIEETNERIGCLLNPETLVMRRMAGVRTRRSATGQLTGEGLTDDPLLYTGGGRTELDLDLLFDVSLAGSSITTQDVRDLTRPLWNLAENAARQERYGQPPLVRFIWGKSWNIPGIILAVAERLEYFTPEGVPRRSWLRMRMVRANEPALEPTAARESLSPDALSIEESEVPEESVSVHEVVAGTLAQPEGERPETPTALQADGLIATTASDIIAEAFAEGQARASLNTALGDVSSAAEAILSELASLAADEEELPEEEQAAAETVTSETNAILSAIESVTEAVETEMIGAVTSAAATISAATDSIRSTLGTMTSEVGGFLAEKIGAAVDEITPAVATLCRTATAVARAVKAKSAVVIATAVAGLSSAVETIDAGVSTVVMAASTAGREALETIGAATKTIDHVLESIRSTGETAARELIPDALERLATGVEILWSAGETAAVRAVESAAKVLAIGLKNVTAATQAIAAVLITPATEVVRSAVATAQTALNTIDLETATREAIATASTVVSRALRRIESALASIAPRLNAETRERLSEEVEALRAVVATSEEIEPAEATVRISQGLDSISEGVEKILSQEKTSTAEVVKAAIATEARASEARTREPPAGLRGGIGERLDQLAYRHYGDPALWRVLATFNHVTHPLRLPAGQLVRVPPLSALKVSHG